MSIKRMFLVGILFTSLVMTVLSGCGPADESPTPSPPDPAVKDQEIPWGAGPISKVFVQKSTDGTDDGFEKLLSSMESEEVLFYRRENADTGLISPDDVVLLKINCQWAERGGTNTDLLKSIIQAIIRHPDTFTGEIIIADNGQSQYGSEREGGSLDWAKPNSKDKQQSVMDVVNLFAAQGVRISGVLWDDFTRNRVAEFADGDNENGFVLEDEEQNTGIRISYPKFTTKYGTKVSFKEGIWDDTTRQYDLVALRVINVPVLKSHGIYQVTGAVKSYMGTNSYALTGGATHNNVGQGAMGTQMAHTRIPVLNIMDAIWIAPEGGPNSPYSRAVAANTILASTDPVALDYWAAKHILMEAAQKSGNRRYESMSPDGATPGTFGYWLRLSMAELQKVEGFPTTMNEERMSVYIGE